MCEIFGIEQSWYMLIGLIFDIAGFVLIGFDLYLIQKRNAVNSKITKTIAPVLEELVSVRQKETPSRHDIYSKQINTLSRRPNASTDFEIAHLYIVGREMNSITIANSRLIATAVDLIVAREQSQQQADYRPMRFTFFGLLLIVTGFILQIAGAWPVC